jgi:hypothetical protein
MDLLLFACTGALVAAAITTGWLLLSPVGL